MTIKKIFFKTIHIIKIFIISIFSFFFNIFSKKSKTSKTISKNIKQELPQKKEKIISSSTTIFNTDLASLKNSHQEPYQKTPTELKILISEIYYNNQELNNTENKDLNQVSSIIIPKLEQEIENKTITNDAELKTKITISLKQIVKDETQIKNFSYNLTKSNSKQQFEDLNNKPLNDNANSCQNIFNIPKKVEIPSQNSFKSNYSPLSTTKMPTKINNPINSKYVSLTPLKNCFVAKTFNEEYILVDNKMQELTSKIPYEIIDFHAKYLKVKWHNHYYIYKFNGEKLEEQEYLDIKLFEKFYTVITKDYNLDIHKYQDPKFKLETPLPVNPANYQNDYELEITNKDYHLKINHNKTEYFIDSLSGIIKNNQQKNINNLTSIPIKETKISTVQNITPEISLNENKSGDFKDITENPKSIPLISKNNNKEEEIPSIKQETLKEIDIITSPQENLINIEILTNEAILTTNELGKESLTKPDKIDSPLENIQPKIVEPKKDEEKNEVIKKIISNPEEIEEPLREDNKTIEKETEIDYEYLNLVPINEQTDSLQNNLSKTIAKENLEDKNYDNLLNEVEYLLNEIAIQKKKKLNPHDIKKLFLTEQKVLNLKTKILNHEELDIKKERNLLHEELRQNELYELENTLEKLHFEHQIELNNHTLKKLEDLNFMNKDKARQIEKVLLKSKIKKASRAMEISSLLSLPFIRNKYFLYFTMSIFVSNHLHLFDNILKHKTENYTKEDLSQIKLGENSLHEALNLTTNNITMLERLEYEASNKFPELTIDSEYMNNLTNLKNALTSQEEKMLKKKQMLLKYQLQDKQYKRILKKDKAA